MDSTVAIAWWGAICGSIALIWDIIKWWRSGVRIKITASPNMQYVYQGSGLSPEYHVSVNVNNVGDKPTTITHLLGYTFESKWHRFRKKPEKQFIITTGPGSPVPHKLEPGCTWHGSALHSELEKLIDDNSNLYLGIQHSVSDNPVLVKVDTSNMKKQLTRT